MQEQKEIRLASLTDKTLYCISNGTLKTTYIPIKGDVAKIEHGLVYNGVTYQSENDFIMNVCLHHAGEHLGRAKGRRPGNVEIGSIDLFYDKRINKPIYWMINWKFIPDPPAESSFDYDW